MNSSRRAVIVFTVIAAIGAAIIAATIKLSPARRAAGGDVASGFVDSLAERDAAAPLPSGRIYFRSTRVDAQYGMLAYVDSVAPGAQATIVEKLTCEAVHASGGRGLCLVADRGVITTYSARIFRTDTHAVLAELPLAGIPSRARVTVDGRFGAVTVFVTGHAYASVNFSTQTLLIDLLSSEVLADVETFTFTENGERISNPDFNVWGVTFLADGNTFYATLSTQGRHLLIRGDARKQTAEAIHENVECPSVSPDGSRIAYKKRVTVNGVVTWHLYVLDAKTFTETPLGEGRSVDDQLEWLDSDHVLYSVPQEGTASTDVWMVPADGDGEPSRLLNNAYSPAVVR